MRCRGAVAAARRICYHPIRGRTIGGAPEHSDEGREEGRGPTSSGDHGPLLVVLADGSSACRAATSRPTALEWTTVMSVIGRSRAFREVGLELAEE